MKEKFSKILKDSDSQKVSKLVMVLVVGLFLLIVSNAFFNRQEAPAKPAGTELDELEEAMFINETRHELDMERRLEEALSLIEGAGQVRVLLNITNNSEVVISQDTIIDESIIKETDDSGGVREVFNTKTDIRNVIVTENGNQRPIVLKEYDPRVEGVVIIAEGGGQAEVQEALIRSVQTLMSIEPHRIVVVRMK